LPAFFWWLTGALIVGGYALVVRFFTGGSEWRETLTGTLGWAAGLGVLAVLAARRVYERIAQTVAAADRREAALNYLSALARNSFGAPPEKVDAAVVDALRLLAEIGECRRARIWRGHRGNSGECGDLLYEWNAAVSARDAAAPVWRLERETPEFFRELQTGNWFALDELTLPEAETAALRQWYAGDDFFGMPIFADDRFWGVLTFEPSSTRAAAPDAKRDEWLQAAGMLATDTILYAEKSRAIELRESNLATIVKISQTYADDDGDFDATTATALRLLGEKAGVDRVCVWNNCLRAGEFLTTAVYEWNRPGVAGLLGTPAATDVQWQSFEPEYVAHLANGQCHNGVFANLVKTAYLRERFQTRSLFHLPIFHNETFWGSITFDDCERDREFTPAEQNFFRVAGNVVASAVTRNEYEANIIQREAKMRAMGNLAVRFSESDESDDHRITMVLRTVTGHLGVGQAHLFRYRFVDDHLFVRLLGKYPEDAADLPAELMTDDGFPVWREYPEFCAMLLDGDTINGPASDLGGDAQKYGELYKCRSLLHVPLYVNGVLWASLAMEDAQNERYFTTDEESFARAVGTLGINVVARAEMLVVLREANREAQASARAKQDFLAHMSHEMRTPLNAVQGLTYLALRLPEVSDKAREYLQIIRHSSATLLDLVNDLLDTSQISAGKFSLRNDAYNVAELLSETAATNAARIGNKPLELRLTLTPPLPAQLFGDVTRVKQVFNNLLSNAVKYTKVGAVEWQVAVERDDEDRWLISRVRDTGIGIKPEDLEKLFVEYTQVDANSNRGVEGTGLGLSLCKKLVESMGGEIAVESVYGKGTVFTVRLRQGAVGDEVLPPATLATLENFSYRLDEDHDAKVEPVAATVLVVDDAAVNLTVAEGMLEYYGITVVCASSGYEALARLQKGEQFRAIFMDHMMPEMDGVETAERIRALGTDYALHVPIIALTANAMAESRQLFADHGFQAFLAKPIALKALDEIIDEWVRPARN
jgi:signal transduction histidine kinase/CheY-like chemotaxis protein